MSTGGRIRDDDIAEVRERARLEEFVEPYTTLRQAGPDSMKGLCPFHDEKTPSFHITRSRGLYHCYGCQVGGDTIRFVQEMEQVSFPEAVRLVARHTGVEIREDPHSGPPQRARRQEAVAAADRFFRSALHGPEAAHARRELENRGLTSDDATAAGCGYAPRDGSRLVATLTADGFAEEDMVAAGLARRGSRGLFAFFRDRLLWPIGDTSGRTVGFGARRLSASDPVEAKFINSPESELFHKNGLLYGLDRARKAAHRAGRVVVVEGYTDVMACWAAGVGEAVATCGTAFGQRHLHLLTRMVGAGCRIVFAFDGDTAGQRAAQRAWRICRDDLNRVYGVHLPTGVDPCDVRMGRGGAALVQTLAAAEPLTKLVIQATADAALGDTAGPEGRSRAAEQVRDVLAQIPDLVLRDGYIESAAEHLRVPRAAVAPADKQTPDRRGTRPNHPNPTAQGGDAAHPSATDRGVLRLERRMLHRVAEDPAAAAQWLPTLDPGVFTSPTAQAVCRALKSAAAEVDVSTLPVAAWAGRVLDHADSDSRQAVSQLLSESSEAVETGTLLTVGRARLEERLLEVRLADARRALAETAGEEQDAWLTTVVDLTAQLETVRSNLTGEETP